jgi:hypothetical protein
MDEKMVVPRFKGTKTDLLKRADPVTDVTAQNYSDLAIAFMRQNGGVGFVICRRECPINGQSELGKATPAQWAAWRAYFARLGVKLTLMDGRDYYTVPAEWPHLFDALATIGDDHAAQPVPRREWSASVLSSEARKVAVVNRLGYDPTKKRGTWKPEPDTERPLKYTDKDVLLECYAEYEAGEKAKKAAKFSSAA